MALEHRAQVNGLTLRYLDAGVGHPLVLVHAFPLNAEMWRPQLDRVPPGWRFLAPDLRGFGATPIEPDPLSLIGDLGDPRPMTVDGYAQDLLAFLDVLSIDRCVFAGLSLGGYIAFALFRRAPARMRGLVLADTRAEADTAEGRRGREALSALVKAKGASAAADDLLPKLLGATSHQERPQLVRECRRMIESANVRAIDAAIQALMARPDSTSDLARIQCPTLVIVGEEDTITPRANAEVLQQAIGGSELAAIRRAGHLSNLETPDEFSTTLADFLRRRL
jgi:pimeloyl-ACP methyl ester carboxylesterase